MLYVFKNAYWNGCDFGHLSQAIDFATLDDGQYRAAMKTARGPVDIVPRSKNAEQARLRQARMMDRRKAKGLKSFTFWIDPQYIEDVKEFIRSISAGTC